MSDVSDTRELELQLDMPKGGTWSWFFQRLSGAVLVLLIMLHLLFTRILEDPYFLGLGGQFLGIQGGAGIEVVTQRLAQAGYITVDILLIIFVIYHAFNGLRMILNDLFDSESIQKTISWILIIVGSIIVIVGTYVLITIRPP